MSTRKTKDLILCALFAALTAVGAFIKIPVPVVPFTLQLLFTMLAGLLLGGRRGAAAVTAYILMGLLGFPVFAEGGGLGYILKPSFGYLIGFAAAAYLTGCIANKVPEPAHRPVAAVPVLLSSGRAGGYPAVPVGGGAGQTADPRDQAISELREARK